MTLLYMYIYVRRFKYTQTSFSTVKKLNGESVIAQKKNSSFKQSNASREKNSDQFIVVENISCFLFILKLHLYFYYNCNVMFKLTDLYD